MLAIRDKHLTQETKRLKVKEWGKKSLRLLSHYQRSSNEKRPRMALVLNKIDSKIKLMTRIKEGIL